MMTSAAAPADLGRLAPVWDDLLAPRFEGYLAAAHGRPESQRSAVALAAALIDAALELQGLSTADSTTPPRLLLADLCLSRASRLLVDTGDQPTQVAFARAVERLAAAAAAQRAEPVAQQLEHVLSESA